MSPFRTGRPKALSPAFQILLPDHPSALLVWTVSRPMERIRVRCWKRNGSLGQDRSPARIGGGARTWRLRECGAGRNGSSYAAAGPAWTRAGVSLKAPVPRPARCSPSSIVPCAPASERTGSRRGNLECCGLVPRVGTALLRAQVVWGGEFGRTSFGHLRHVGDKVDRDHHSSGLLLGWSSVACEGAK